MNEGTLRPCGNGDFDAIWTIINDGARAYQGRVPADCLRDPYMSREELKHEIAAGVKFWAMKKMVRCVG